MRPLLVILGLVGFVALLHYAFPYTLQDSNARLRVLYLVLLLAVIFAGRKRKWKRPLPKVARDAGIWLAVLIGLVFAYSMRDELMHNRLVAELMPSRVQVDSNGNLAIRASEDGHFYIEGKVNGTLLKFLIDTGASDIVLSPADAKRAGIHTESLDYSHIYATANGAGSGAWIEVPSLEVGPIKLRDIPVSVNKTDMRESLLGMSFLRKLNGFRVEGSKLVLIP